tara:strand:+ start:304 stop:690 length:387 start_codon:yes stop_codon:yes gene_type:complete
MENLLSKLEQAINDCLIVPNHWLPESMHDNVRGGRTLSELERSCDKRDEVSEHVKLKELKARNIEKLRKQVEQTSRFNQHGDFIDLEKPLDWSDNEVDEIQLHKNQMALVGGMINSGMISKEDLEDEI